MYRAFNVSNMISNKRLFNVRPFEEFYLFRNHYIKLKGSQLFGRLRLSKSTRSNMHQFTTPGEQHYFICQNCIQYMAF